ncbi:rod shape-determining protein MreC [Frateuria aurantia]
MALPREGGPSLFAGPIAGTLRLVMYLAIALVVMVLDHRNGWMYHVRYAASVIVEPLYRLAGQPSRSLHALTVAFADRSLLTEQNRELRQDLLLANAKLSRMSEVARQNTHLRELLDTQHSLDINVQLARVIGVDLGAFRHRLTINLGSRQGVQAGQPVIDAHGLLGQVVNVLPTTAEVMLVTDPDHAVPVTIERTGLRTVAYGSHDEGLLTLPEIPGAADVRAGDRLLTSGLGGRFPAGFPVGTVIAAGASNGMFLEASARPAADIDRADEVLLLHDLAEPIGPPGPAPQVGPPAALAPPPLPASPASRAAVTSPAAATTAAAATSAPPTVTP